MASRTIAAVNDQRAKVGLKPVAAPAATVTPTQKSTGVNLQTRTLLPGAQKMNSRAAEQNAAQQDAKYRDTMMNGNADGKQGSGMVVEMVTDPNTGQKVPKTNPDGSYVGKTFNNQGDFLKVQKDNVESQLADIESQLAELDQNDPANADKFGELTNRAGQLNTILGDNLRMSGTMSGEKRFLALQERLKQLSGPMQRGEWEDDATFQQRMADAATERTALLDEARQLQDQYFNGKQQFAQQGQQQPGAPVAKGNTGGATKTLPGAGQINQSRKNAVDALVRRGVTDPTQLTNYLNYDEQGNLVGDFTPEEVQQYMGMQGGQQQTGGAAPVPGAPTDGSQPIPGTEPGATATTDANGNPVMAPPDTASMDMALLALPPALRPVIASMMQSYKNREGNAADNLISAMSDIAEDEKWSQTFYEQGEKAALESRNKELRLTGKMDDLSRDYQDEAYRKSMAENARNEEKFNVDEFRAEQLQRDDNVQTERQNRLVAAKLGINYDGGGLNWMQEQVKKGNDTLSYMMQKAGIVRKEFGDQRIGIINSMALNMREIDMNTQIKYDGAFETYNSTLASLRKDRIMDRQALRKAKRDEAQKYYDKLDAIDTERGNLYLKANDQAMEMERNQTAKEQTAKDDAYKMFTWAFSNSTDPVLRSRAAALMTKAGYDMTGVDVNALSIDQQLKFMDKVKDQEAESLYDPFRYGDAESQDIMSSALNAVAAPNMNKDLQTAQLKKITSLLDRGDVKGAQQALTGIVASALTGPTQIEFQTITSESNMADSLVSDLQRMNTSGKVRNIYTMKWNDAKKFFGASKDPEWLDISARMADMASQEIQKRSGAAVSPAEFERLEPFIPQTGDTVLDALTKLRGFKKSLDIKSNAIINTQLGRVGNVSEGGTYSNTKTYGNGFIDGALNGADSGGGTTKSLTSFFGDVATGESQDFNTKIASREKGGLYDASTVKAWGGKHAGVDLTMPQGTVIKSPINGTVKAVGVDGGWGGTYVIVDDKGAEVRLSHLSAFLGGLKPGMRVQQGQDIAKSGGKKGTKGAGNSTGPHLDLRVKVAGKYVDPNNYFLQS